MNTPDSASYIHLVKCKVLPLFSDVEKIRANTVQLILKTTNAVDRLTQHP